MRFKRFIVNGLEWVCGIIDGVPAVRRSDEGWTSLKFYRHGCIGCYPLRLTELSIRLDEHWDTGRWKKSK